MSEVAEKHKTLIYKSRIKREIAHRSYEKTINSVDQGESKHVYKTIQLFVGTTFANNSRVLESSFSLTGITSHQNFNNQMLGFGPFFHFDIDSD